MQAKGRKNGIIEYSLQLCGVNVWSLYYHKRFGWFRLFGYGLKWKDITIHGLTFSERLGRTKSIWVGCWLIGFLKKTTPLA